MFKRNPLGTAGHSHNQKKIKNMSNGRVDPSCLLQKTQERFLAFFLFFMFSAIWGPHEKVSMFVSQIPQTRRPLPAEIFGSFLNAGQVQHDQPPRHDSRNVKDVAIGHLGVEVVCTLVPQPAVSKNHHLHTRESSSSS